MEKLSFVNKFFPRTTNTHSVARKETSRLKNFGLLSPSTKRKGEGGISAEFYSPGKRQRNFKNTLNFWEDKAMDSRLISESAKLMQPVDENLFVLEVDNGSGGRRVDKGHI